MRSGALPLVLLVLGALPLGTALDPTAEDPAPAWNDCLACHDNPGAGLPQLSQLRPVGAGGVLADNCYDCHEVAELEGLRPDWRHPVRPVAAHLECTACHPVIAHGAERPPPRPYGDYEPEGCYECHRTVELRRSLFSRHEDDPRQRCRDCHPAHAPFMAALPVAFAPTGVRQQWLGAYDWWSSNADCLGCHSELNLMYRLDQGFCTLNTTNYHELHVLRGKVLCLECHAPHGSMHPALLRTELLTGELLSYWAAPDGGTCSVRCHGVNHDDWTYTNRVD